ncbi:MAG: M16 family metallopeptidase [Opitutales bacterium]
MDPSNDRVSAQQPPWLDRLLAETVHAFSLPNGLTVLHKPDFSAEVVSAQAWVRTGSLHEAPLLGSGLSHYVEHMVFKGTHRRSGRELTREVHGLGGNLNAYTTFNRTVYYIDAPSEGVHAVLDLLGDLVLNARLDADDARSEREVILREIDMGLDDPDRQMARALFQTAFKKHPYRHPVIGHRPLFSSLQPDELQAYYKYRYVPNNVVLIVAGAVSADVLQQAVEATWGTYAMGRLTDPVIPDEPLPLARREVHRIADTELTRGGLAFPIPGLADPDTPGISVLSSVLGAGRSSLLWRRLREEQGLVHGIGAHAWVPGGRGLFWISYQCDPDKQAAVEPAIWEVIEETMRTGIPESRVDKARREAMIGEINTRKTMSGQAMRLGMAEVVVGDREFSRTYLERLRSVPADDLPSLMGKVFVRNQVAAVSLGRSVQGRRQTTDASGEGLPPFAEHRLANGIRVWLQPTRRLPKVALGWLAEGGPRFEPADQRGITQLLATLLTRDTGRRSAEAVSELIEQVGGDFDCFSGNNSFGLEMEVMMEDLDLGIDLLADALRRPTFKESTLRREIDAQVAEFQEITDDVVSFARREARKAFFREHPFAVNAIGLPACIRNLRTDDLQAYADRLVSPHNGVLVAAGSFEPEDLLKRLDAALGDWSGQAVEPPYPPYAGPEKPTTVQFHRESAQTVVHLVFPDVGVRDEDHVVGDAVNELCSGMASHLFETVREEQGLAYFIGAGRISGTDCGAFVFFGGTAPDTADRVVAAIDAEIERLGVEGPAPEELERARKRLKAQRRMGRQNLSSRVFRAGLNALYGQPVNDAEDFDNRVDALDPEAISAYVRRQFTPDRRIAVLVGPERQSASGSQSF